MLCLLTREFFARGLPHRGVLLLPRTLPADKFTVIARASRRYVKRYRAPRAITASMTSRAADASALTGDGPGKDQRGLQFRDGGSENVIPEGLRYGKSIARHQVTWRFLQEYFLLWIPDKYMKLEYAYPVDG
jgi:hypothetical protein